MRPTLLLSALLIGCAARADRSSPNLMREAEQVLESYRRAWVDGDSAAVMSHVSDEFQMFSPSRTVSGKEQIRVFWFPGGDTVYPIRQYDIRNQRVYGAGEFAVAEGTSLLAWDTTVRDSVIASATSKSEYINVLRKEAGAWKLYRAIFVMR
jgi:ketosteroid isomerase-like protein